jgi:DNA-binding MltR family transcriptional regulator
LESADDATVVIVTAAWLDDALSELWKRRMLPRNSEQNDLLRPDGPLGSLSVKAKLAFMVGWLPRALHQELRHLRDIRNGFAHSRSKLSLTQLPFRQKCKELRIADAYNAGGPMKQARSPRQRLLISSFIAAREILRLADNSSAPHVIESGTPFLMAIRREVKSYSIRQALADA